MGCNGGRIRVQPRMRKDPVVNQEMIGYIAGI